MPDPDHRAPAPSEELGPPKMVITLNPDGTVKVSGPLADETLAYGMLEQAKYAIFVHNRPWLHRPEARVVIPETPPIRIPLPRSGREG